MTLVALKSPDRGKYHLVAIDGLSREPSTIVIERLGERFPGPVRDQHEAIWGEAQLTPVLLDLEPCNRDQPCGTGEQRTKRQAMRAPDPVAPARQWPPPWKVTTYGTPLLAAASHCQRRHERVIGLDVDQLWFLG